MHEVVVWLREQEQRAADFYRGVAKLMPDRPDWERFFLDLAAEEDAHAQLLDQAGEHLIMHPAFAPDAVRIGAGLRGKVEEPLLAALRRIKEGRLSPREALEFMAETEFSEWNDLFLYVLERTKDHFRSFQRLAATVQAHERHIERFLEALPPEIRPSKDVMDLPALWNRRILIVDDSEDVRDGLTRFLRRMGEIVEAENGAEALTLARAKFFDAIVSDISMPVMDGPTWYSEVVRTHPDVRPRFIFMTGAPSPEVQEFAKARGLTLMCKPFDPQELVAAVESVIAQAGRAVS